MGQFGSLNSWLIPHWTAEYTLNIDTHGENTRHLKKGIDIMLSFGTFNISAYNLSHK